jgi:segregation and condensation protein A
MDDGLDASVTTPTAEPSDGSSAGSVDLGVRVTTEGFSGPLDLLLYLVRRTELDIVDIPLVLIIDQFVATIGQWADLDLEVAGDFIAMAATLLEIKARLIAPPPEEPLEGGGDEGDAFDPRADLINSLLAYRRFKEATQELAAREDARRERLDRQLRETIPEDPEDEPTLELGAVDSHLLLRTCELLMARINGLGPRTVTVDDVPLGVHIDRIVDAVRTKGTSTLGSLITAAPTMLVRVSTVMAVLEGTRQRFLESRQVEQYGDVGLRYRDEEERARVAELPPEAPPEARRRRRPPLVTWTPPASAAPVGEETPAEAADDEVVESDDERFLRELDESCRLNAVLAASADLERAYTAFLTERHPDLLPPAPVVVAAVEVVAPSAAPVEPVEEKPEPVAVPVKRRAAPVAAAPPVAAATEDVPAVQVPVVALAPHPSTDAPPAAAPATDVVSEAAAPALADPPASETAAAPASSDAAAVGAVPPAAEGPATRPTRADDSVAATAQTAHAADVAIPPVAPVEAAGTEIEKANGATPIAAPLGGEPVASAVPEAPTEPVAHPAETNAASADAAPARAAPIQEASSSAPEPSASAPTAAVEDGTPAMVPERTAAATQEAVPAPLAESEEPAQSATQLPAHAVAPTDALAATGLPLLDAAGANEGVDAIPAELRAMSPADTLLALAAPALAQEAAGGVPAADEVDTAAPAVEADSALDPAVATEISASAALAEVATTPHAPVAAEVERWTSREDEPRAWPVEAAAEALEARLAAEVPEEVDEADDEEAAPIQEGDDEFTASDDPASANAMLLRELEAAAETRRAALERERRRQVERAAAAAAAAGVPAQSQSAESSESHPARELPVDRTAAAELPADRTAAVLGTAPSNGPAPDVAAAPASEAALPGIAASHPDLPVESTSATPDAAATIGAAPADAAIPAAESPPPGFAESHSASDLPAESTSAIPDTDPTIGTAPVDATTLAAEPDPPGIIEAHSVPELPAESTPAVPDAASSAGSAPDVVAPPIAVEAEADTPARPPARPSSPVSRAATETRLVPIVASDGVPPPPPPPDPGPPPGRRPRRPATFPLASSPTTLLLPNTQQNAQRRPMPAPPLHRRPWFAATAGFALAGLAGWGAYEWLLWLPKDILEVAQGPLPDQEVSGRATLRWSFNLDVVAPEQVGKPEQKPPTLTPATAGTWTWTDRRSLSFTPDQPLVDGTPYTIALAKDQLRTSAGFRLAQDLRATVHTPALAVREARLVTYGENGAATVEMLFNQPVDPAAIAKRLIVEAPGGDGAARPVVSAQGAARAAVVRFAIAGLPQPAFEKDSAPPADPATSGGALLSAPAGGHVVSHPGVTALLRLPGGTTGAGGPLGLEREWSSALPLGATLALTDAWAQIPAAGDASVHLGLNGGAIPAELLAKLVHVMPALRVKIEAVPGGLVLHGGFTPGESYTVALDAVWPEHGDDPTLALASLPAACTATLAIPQRPRALWLERVDGLGQVTVRGSRVESAALAVYPADAAADAEPLRRSHVTLAATSDEEPARLSLDAQRLLGDLPTGSYEVRLAGDVADADADSAPTLSIRLHLDAVAVAPGAVAAGLGRWTIARLRGEEDEGLVVAIGRAEAK